MTSPQETIYGPFDNSAWVNIPCTIAACRRMVVCEVPPQSANPPVQGANAPQGLSYQRWDPNFRNADGTLGGFETAIHEALPDEEIPTGDGMTLIGWPAQSISGGSVGSPNGGVVVRPADTPIRVRSGTATNTQVRAREWSRGFAINS